MKGEGRPIRGAGGRRGLPPGPRMPSAVQAIGWARRPYPFMKRCQERLGDTFTLRERDSMSQKRITESDLFALLEEQVY